MDTFKVGDWVYGKPGHYDYQHRGSLGNVIEITTTGWFRVKWKDGYVDNYQAHDLIIADKKSTTMSTLKDRVAVMFKGEPEKSFIKAGVMNTDETLTTDGETIFKQFLFKKFAADFKKEVVDPLLAEDKE